MENLRIFLESSTIHGLAYISSAKKWMKVFWIIIVTSGFIGSGVMIFESFQMWEESPIKTTLETLPITEITLPKVIVCPPKNTFTNLNFGLRMLSNMTLDNKTRNDLTYHALHQIQDYHYREVLSNFSLLEEENRYYNWYMGYTAITLPYWGLAESCKFFSCEYPTLIYRLDTSTTSGSISTKHFGETFDAEEVYGEIKIIFHVYPPDDYVKDENITLHFEIEKDTIKGFDKFSDFYEEFDVDLDTFTKNFTPPDYWQSFTLQKRISKEDIYKLDLNSMPGFKLNWKYSEDLWPDKINSIINPQSNDWENGHFEEISKQFAKLVNLIHMSGMEKKKLWTLIKEYKFKYLVDNFVTFHTFPCVQDVGTGLISIEDITENIENIGKELNETVSHKIIDNIEEETYETAGEMFLFLNLCPKLMNEWIIFYVNLFQNSSPDVMAQALNRILKIENEKKDKLNLQIAQKIFKNFRKKFSVQLRSIESLTEADFIDEANLGIVQKDNNHPVHIIDEEGNLSKSAFIPFCEFAGNLSVMGEKIDEFQYPVCNSFKPRIMNDELCYEVNLNKYKDSVDMEQKLKVGLVFFMDYNEDRQVLLNESMNKEESFVDVMEGNHGRNALIYLDTIKPVKLSGEGIYNLNVVKEFKVTNSYLGLDMDVRRCQNDLPIVECSTKNYIDSLLQECGCLPFSIRIYKKINVCNSIDELTCAGSVEPTSPSCVGPCEGMMITSYSKSDFLQDLKHHIPISINDYRNFKKWAHFTKGTKDYEWENNLKYVRIFFDTPTFDRITKDRAAKFVDMLSAIGGTMGLLTGFSIISAVEILYFSVKIILNAWKKRNKDF